MTENYSAGSELTVFLLEMAGLAPGRILNLGSQQTTAYLESLGFHTAGDDCFDAVIAEDTGNVPAAAEKAAGYLNPGGTLLLADLCFTDVKEHVGMLEQAGFHVLHVEDATFLWLEYHPDHCSDEQKNRYFLTICEKL